MATEENKQIEIGKKMMETDSTIKWLDKLPPELWARILSRLHDPKELGDLEMVSKRFRSFVMDSCWTQINQIQLNTRGPAWFPVSLNNTYHLKLKATESEQQIPALLNKLSNLTSISLAGAVELHEVLKDIQTTHLKELALELESTWHSLVPEFIRNANKSLTQLSVQFAFDLADQLESYRAFEAAVVSCQELETLNLEVHGAGGHTHDFFSEILKSSSLSNLKHLSLKAIYLAQEPLNALPAALQSCGAQLETLELKLSAPTTYILNKYLETIKEEDPHPLKTLKKLTFEIEVHHSPVLVYNSLIGLCPQLNEIILYLDTNDNVNFLWGVVENCIQSILSTGNRHVSVTFLFDGADVDEDDLVDVVGSLEEAFPGLSINHSENSAVFEWRGAKVQILFQDYGGHDDGWGTDSSLDFDEDEDVDYMFSDEDEDLRDWWGMEVDDDDVVWW